MTRTIVLWLYLIAMVILGLVDVMFISLTESIPQSILNALVNSVLVLSIWFFLKHKLVHWWHIVLLPTLVLQGVFLVQGYLQHGQELLFPYESLFLLPILIPPAIMGFYVGVARAKNT
ncbi:MAG: hypothetical protein R3E64_09555 [Halioglobus sp.]